MKQRQAPAGEPDARLFDVTDPTHTVALKAGAGGGPAFFGGIVPGHRYWFGVPTEAPPPRLLRPAQPLERASLEGVEYLAIAPAEFHAALEPLVAHRRAQGLDVATVTPQAVYDTFGAGRPDPEAIRALVQALPTLRYLLLAGDGASDPAGYDGEAGALRVVAPLTRTATLGETPADLLLGTGADGQTRVAIGRFPATSAREVEAMVDKTIAWETQKEAPNVVVLSDDEPEFTTMASEIVSALPGARPVQWVDVAQGNSRDEVIDALREAPVWLNFTGHGSPAQLCDEGILTADDGATWQPAVIVAWTCLAGHFLHPTHDSLAETWLRSPRGGAVAFLGPVGETTPGEQRPFIQAFYRALHDQSRLGDAWCVALQIDGSPDVALGYTILGDPALILAPTRP